MGKLVAFTIDQQAFALPLASVERVIHMLEVTPLPGGPEIVAGVISLQGRILPVLDIRKRFGLPPRDPEPADQLIVAHSALRTVVLPVDSVAGVISPPVEEITETMQTGLGNAYIEGVAHFGNGVVLIHNLDRFLSPHEEAGLEASITEL